MRKSQHLGYRDLRTLYLLVGECRELGADPVAWQAHALQGLLRLLDAAHGACFGLERAADPDLSRGSMAMTFFVDGGLSDPNIRRAYRQLIPQGVSYSVRHSVIPVGSPDLRLSSTFSRRQMMDDSVWYGSDFILDFIRQTGLDDFVGSQSFTSSSSAFSFGFNRLEGDSPFARRERRLLRLVVADIIPLLGTRLATGTTPSVTTMALRLRQVLLCLFEGDGEKQVAARLGISSHTVHEYVRRLHRLFEVSSRGELLARCAPLLPSLHAIEKAERGHS